MLAPLEIIDTRDRLAEMADDAIASAGGPAHKRDLDRRYIHALCSAWLDLDRAVQQLAEEE